MTVQELIDYLQTIEDKGIPVLVETSVPHHYDINILVLDALDIQDYASDSDKDVMLADDLETLERTNRWYRDHIDEYRDGKTKYHLAGKALTIRAEENIW